MVKAATKPVNRLASNGNGEHPVAEQPVRVHELDIRTLMVWVVGTSPLITHNWDTKTIRMIEDKQAKKATKGREAKDPKAEYQAARYLDSAGKDCVPARAFKNAMVSAATSLDDRKMSKTKIRQVVFIEGDLLPIESKSGAKMRTDMVRIGTTGTADVRYRPEYADWKVLLTIRYNAAAISAEQVVNLLELAGFAVGICEWRPEKNGNNGQFRCERKK
jgi:hypothetical protein